MKLFLKLTDNVIKQNLRQLVLFTFLYRLVAGIFYVKTVNGILRFSLHMAGYSYLTTGNLRAFLLRPVTVFAVIFISNWRCNIKFDGANWRCPTYTETCAVA